MAPDDDIEDVNEEATGEMDAEEIGTADAEEPAELEEVDPVAAERDRLKDKLLRTAADFDNFRKRTKRDLEEARRRAIEDTLREVLPIIDNLERAVAASGEADDVEAVAEGVRMVLKSFDDVAQKLGVERIAAVGERFDPNVHDAVQQAVSEEHPAGTILAEVVPGYRMGERLIRAALVVVSRGSG